MASGGALEFAGLVGLEGGVGGGRLGDAFRDALVAIGLKPVDRDTGVLIVEASGTPRTGRQRVARDREALDQASARVERRRNAP